MSLQEKIKSLFYLILKEDNDNILNLRGGRGYSPGHPYPKKMVKPLLGKVEGEEISKDKEKIKVSKVFKRKKRSWCFGWKNIVSYFL